MKLLIATNNPHKLEEMRRILASLGVQTLSMKDIGVQAEAEETGKTFAENAYIKAKELFDKTGIPTVADDSGLCVDALGGRPGVYSARYGGEDTPHSRKIEMLLNELDGIPDEKRNARFACAICCVLDNDTIIECEGTCEGKIGYEPRGNFGFGYDPILMVGSKSFAELSPECKDEISHRGQALKTFAERLKEAILR